MYLNSSTCVIAECLLLNPCFLVAAQAVLALPLACADVAVQLPPSLRLAATAAGRLDCRLQLLSVTAEWPVSRQPHTAGTLHGSASCVSTCYLAHLQTVEVPASPIMVGLFVTTLGEMHSQMIA